MKYIRILFPVFCSLLIWSSCSKHYYPIAQLKKQLTGSWKLVSQGGGFGNLPETETKDDVVIEFTSDGVYRSFTDNTLQTETRYTIKYAESVITGKENYVIVLKDEKPYLNFTVSDTELVLSGDHVDAMYFKYTKTD